MDLYRVQARRHGRCRVFISRYPSSMRATSRAAKCRDLKRSMRKSLTGQKSLSHGNITFKRPVMPLSEPFTVWMNDCFNSMKTMEKKIRTFDMVIKLLNSQGSPLAGWLGRYAYPVKWSLINLDAAKSELSHETITMICASLKRITNNIR